MRMSAALDTDELPEPEAAEAVWTLEELASAPPAPIPGSPLPRYWLSIGPAGGARVLELDESQVPAGLRPLISALMARATPSRKNR